MEPITQYTPAEKLAKKIARYKAACKSDIATARLQYTLETLPAQTAARKIKTGVDGGELRKYARLFQNLTRERRVEISKCIVGKALTVNASITTGFYMSLDLKASPEVFTVSFNVYNGIRFDHKIDFAVKPSEAELILIARAYFPNVKSVII
jgi:hypothetical protein